MYILWVQIYFSKVILANTHTNVYTEIVPFNNVVGTSWNLTQGISVSTDNTGFYRGIRKIGLEQSLEFLFVLGYGILNNSVFTWSHVGDFKITLFVKSVHVI